MGSWGVGGGRENDVNSNARLVPAPFIKPVSAGCKWEAREQENVSLLLTLIFLLVSLSFSQRLLHYSPFARACVRVCVCARARACAYEYMRACVWVCRSVRKTQERCGWWC